MYDKEIAVIGGGISGITTALTLQLLGFPTTCYARDLVPGPGEEDYGHESDHGSGRGSEPDPRFASLYPAASVIPHSIEAGGRLKPLFTATQKVFTRLAARSFTGLVRHRHYEVFEFPREVPPYVSLLENPRLIHPDDHSLPRRSGAGEIHGWVFNCWFTEWPFYIRALYRAFRGVGGRLVRREIDRDGLRGLPEEILVNCTGVWSPRLFAHTDHGEHTPEVELGHLVTLPEAPVHRDEEGRILSYNYTPRPEIYADPEGEACDVYFYPRSNGWVIGGSRIRGRLLEDGRFDGPEPGDTVKVGGQEIPGAILELNGDILRTAYGLDLARYGKRIARTGYRYMGDPRSGGLVLSSGRELGRKVIHNYGHGGAGVTLSWGCALAAAILTRRETGAGYQEGLNEVCLQLLDALQRVRVPESGEENGEAGDTGA